MVTLETYKNLSKKNMKKIEQIQKEIKELQLLMPILNHKFDGI